MLLKNVSKVKVDENVINNIKMVGFTDEKTILYDGNDFYTYDGFSVDVTIRKYHLPIFLGERLSSLMVNGIFFSICRLLKENNAYEIYNNYGRVAVITEIDTISIITSNGTFIHFE